LFTSSQTLAENYSNESNCTQENIENTFRRVERQREKMGNFFEAKVSYVKETSQSVRR